MRDIHAAVVVIYEKIFIRVGADIVRAWIYCLPTNLRHISGSYGLKLPIKKQQRKWWAEEKRVRTSAGEPAYSTRVLWVMV